MTFFHKIKQRYSGLAIGVRAAIWFTACSALTHGINFLVMPFLTRFMPSNQYAVITVYNSWLAILLAVVTLTLYGSVFNTAMMKYHDCRPKLLSSSFGLVFMLCAGFFVLLLACSQPAIRLFGLDYPLLLALPVNLLMTAEFSLWSAYQRFEYNYMKMLYVTAVYILLPAIAAVVATALWPIEDQKAAIKVWVQLGVDLPIILALGVGVVRRGGLPINRGIWKYLIVFAIPLVPHYLSMMLLGQLDRIMVANLCGAIDAAIYGVAYQISLASSIVTSAVTSALAPWTLAILSKKTCTKTDAKTMNAVSILIAVINMMLVIVAPEIMKIAAPAEYQNAVYLIPVIACSSYFSYLYAVFINVELFYERKIYAIVISCSAAILNILMNLLLLPYFGYMAAGYTTLFCYALMGIAHSLIAKKLTTNTHVGLYDYKALWLIGVGLIAVNQVFAFAYESLPARIAAFLILVVVIYRNREIFISSFSKTRKRGRL